MSVPGGQGDMEATPLLHTRAAVRSAVRRPAQNPGVYSPEPLTMMKSCIHLVKGSWLNVLALVVPFGILSKFLGWGAAFTFWLNFVAIVPMAAWLSLATEEIALHTNETLGGLINATFGNAVELIISVMALRGGLVKVVQNSLLGSVLSNSLLVLGLCFLAGGWRYPTQTFNKTAAQTSGSMLMLAVLSLLIPAALAFVLQSDGDPVKESVLILSHGTAIVLLIIYFLYLFFQMKTHKTLFIPEHDQPAEEEEHNVYSLPFSIGLLLVSTAVIAVCSEGLVDSIEGLTEQWGVSQTFVGLVLLPIVGNAAEHASAITVSIKDKMDLALGIAIGSSMQIALLATPLLVIVGWIIGTPMTLFFEPFQTLVLFISVIIVVSLISDGTSNWLEGAMLLATYTIVSIAFLLLPDVGTNM